MPKFGSHIIFAEEAHKRRPDLFPNFNLNAYRFGAVGPDVTLFMFDPATSNPDIRKGFKVCLDVLESIQDIKKQIEDVVDKLTQPISDIQDWLSGGLSTDLSYTVNTAIETMLLAVKLGMAEGSSSINLKNPLIGFFTNPNFPVDFIKNEDWKNPTILISALDNYGFPFRMFGHPYTDDGTWKQPEPTGDYSNWWRMDMLHYRKTATFAYEMLSKATTSAQQSYARGYMTHVAGDITGHPFINSLVGGPFRNHAFRHLVLETLADTWLWDQQGRGDVLDSRLNEKIDVTNSEAEEIANLVTAAMKEVYKSPMVPKLLSGGYPSNEEFLFGYDALKQYLRLSTGGSVKRPTAPPDTPKELFKEIQELLQNNLPGNPPVWKGDLASFLEALFAWFGKGLALLAMIATLPYAVMMRFLAIAPRWILYFLNLGIFYIHSAIRTMICMVGWGYAGKEDFDNFSFLENLITSKQYSGENNQYPYKTLPNPKLPFYWLQPPSWLGEIEKRGLHPQAVNKAVQPDWMLSIDNTMNPEIVDALINAATPAATLAIQNQIGKYPHGFGNAIDFGINILDGTIKIPDFDLDGDRGYGYKGWEELPPNEYYV
ncbi:hypothetical protein IDJ77_03460 [Mucilaginibacter sp. ZT4R22]|uniref:Zinc dependent phospholipase C n=1 Tax=Mucilaginibacter pankratovii TaxID=2772110 RepID=A0ABR7WMY4_9SPHI|nr:zinc dependent phospholipase C family protein [Mucilaginibacter pankratovii]MBD1362857.1 hypothetical protein [Mucilaginibacter pankratovii]